MKSVLDKVTRDEFNMVKRITVFLLLSINMVNCQQHLQRYDPGFDFALFDNTPVSKLAKAVELDDTLKISEFVTKNKVDVNYQESKFGNTLLTLALINNKHKAAVRLLQLGAMPNLRSPKDNSSPFLLVCNYPYSVDNIAEMLSLLIRYGADVNSVQVREQNNQGHTTIIKRSGLQNVCASGTVDCVKILVDNGASLDNYPKNGQESLIYKATINPKLDILKYLLIDKKATIPDYCAISEEGTTKEKKVTLREIINSRNFIMDDHDIAVQAEILAYLKDHGK